MQLSEQAVKVAESICNYCSTRFPTDSPPDRMLDGQWFAEKVQIAIGEASGQQKIPNEVFKLIAVACTAKKRNTTEWMTYFAEVLSAAIKACGSDDEVTYPGAWSNEFHFSIGGGL